MRLIDADKIGLTDFEIIMCQGDYREAFKMLLDKINNQAIVFDIDKVITELKNRIDEASDNCLCEMHENGHTLNFENENGRIRGLREAIRIIEQGVID